MVGFRYILKPEARRPAEGLDIGMLGKEQNQGRLLGLYFNKHNGKIEELGVFAGGGKDKEFRVKLVKLGDVFQTFQEKLLNKPSNTGYGVSTRVPLA